MFVRLWCDTNLCGTNLEHVIEVDDDTSEEELYQYAQDFMESELGPTSGYDILDDDSDELEFYEVEDLRSEEE